MIDIKKYLREKKEIIDAALDRYLPPEDEVPGVIHKSMRYSVFAGGKRLRPIMVIASAEAVGGSAESVLPAACAIEMIHTYSLIHDDLPAMDNDDFRRGVPTNHKVFGEAMAILAGDALLTLAFNVLACCFENTPPSRVIKVIEEISFASGTFGMIGGQVVDVQSEGADVTPETLQYIHSHKTAALFVASVRTGAILSGAKEEELQALTSYAEHLGLAFQIADDILDITGDSEKMGKTAGSDARKKKATFPSLYGLDRSREMVEAESRRAIDVIEEIGSRAEPLKAIALYLVSRDR